MDTIREHIKTAYSTTSERLNDLQIAEQKVPIIMEHIAMLAKENEQTYIGLTDHICAGREILRELKEVKLPEAKQEAAASGDFESVQRTSLLQQTEETLDYQLAILEQARQGTVISTSQLMDMDKAIRTNCMAVRSILNTEIPALQRDISTAGLALDTYDTTNLTKEFREFTERTKDAAVVAVNAASEAARLGRMDSPEHLQRAIDRLQAIETQLSNQATLNGEMETQREQKRIQLESLTAEVLTAISTNTSQDNQALTASNENYLLTGGPQDGKGSTMRTIQNAQAGEYAQSSINDHSPG